jgi:hypothetical protein
MKNKIRKILSQLILIFTFDFFPHNHACIQNDNIYSFVILSKAKDLLVFLVSPNKYYFCTRTEKRNGQRK